MIGEYLEYIVLALLGVLLTHICWVELTKLSDSTAYFWYEKANKSAEDKLEAANLCINGLQRRCENLEERLQRDEKRLHDIEVFLQTPTFAPTLYKPPIVVGEKDKLIGPPLSVSGKQELKKWYRENWGAVPSDYFRRPGMKPDESKDSYWSDKLDRNA